MKKLEDFIRDNKADFDSKLPSTQLWDKIESQLENNTPKSHAVKLWKLSAAVAAVLVLAIVGTFMYNAHNTSYMRYAKISDTELRELLETEAYYSEKVSYQMNEIHKCYKIYPDLKEDIESDLNELDNMYDELKSDLGDDFYNREVIEAMIQNNRLKLEMVDRVLAQIDC